MKTAAVILNYNDPEATKGAVERLRHFRAIDDVIVVDNASTDNSARKLGSYLKRINAEDADGGPDRYTLVLSDRNGGYGYGNNIGLRYACEITGSGLCLIANPDSVFDEGLVGAMKSCFEDEEVAAAGAVMRSGSSMNYGDFRASAWPLRSLFWEVLASGPICRRLFGSRLSYGRRHFQETGARREVAADCVHGSLVMLDTEKVLAAGGYDEGIFLYCEETVLGRRLKDSGYRTVLVTGRSYAHAGGSSIKHAGLGALRRQRFRQRSERYYYRHYLSAGPISMAAVRLFQWAVLLETLALELVERLGRKG